MGTTIQDVLFGFRMMRRWPGTTVLAVLTMTLGIGANTAIFSLVDSTLLRPLPYPDSDSLYSVRLWSPNTGVSTFSMVDYLALEKEGGSFSSFSAYYSSSYGVTVADSVRRVRGANVDDSFFRTIQVMPFLGRGFREDENRPGTNRVVVINHALWQRLGGDPSMIGDSIRLGGRPHEVIGVLPEDFRFPAGYNPEVIVLFERAPPPRRGPFFMNGIARLKEGVGREAMDSELTAVAEGVRKVYPGEAEWRFHTEPLQERLVGHTRSNLVLLLGAVGLVLLIACVNVANLLLGRAASRAREIAVRAAMGAGRRRLVRQLLTESLLLSSIGALGGIGLSLALLAGLPSSPLLPGYPGLGEVPLDGRIFAFTLAVTLASGVLFGLAPALQGSRWDVSRALNASGRSGSESRSRRRLRSGLVVAEFALALMLLVGAGLLLRSFLELQRVEVGFETGKLLTALVSLPSRGGGLFARSDPAQEAQRIPFYDRLAERVKALPGVSGAGFASNMPPDDFWFTNDFNIRGRPVGAGESPPVEIVNVVSVSYFDALGIRVLDGRSFDAVRDRSDSPFISIVDRAFVEKYFEDGVGVGKRILWGDSSADAPGVEIVGVVENVRNAGLEKGFKPTWYMSMRQFPPPPETAFLFIRTALDPKSLVPQIRQQVRELNPQATLARVAPMEERVAVSVSTPRFRALLMLVFAGVALVLAAVGIYGVMSYTVVQRTREMGIRMALGAARSQVFRQVIGDGARLAVTGLMLGVAASLALTWVISGFLFGVSPLDPVTFIFVSLGLLVVGLLASSFPTLRATRIEPVTALREE